MDRNETFKRRGSLLIRFMANQELASPAESEPVLAVPSEMDHPLEDPLPPSSAVFLHFNLAGCIYHQLQPAPALCEDGDIKNSQPAVERA